MPAKLIERGPSLPMPPLTLTLLGGFEARQGSTPLRPLARKTQAFLAYLALEERALQRHELATLLWGESGEAQARQSLRKAFSVLRRSLGSRADAILVVHDHSVGLNAAAVDIDTRRFTRLAAEATPASLAEAAALYRGHLLAGLDLDEPAFNDWLLSRRERLREIALNANEPSARPPGRISRRRCGHRDRIAAARARTASRADTPRAHTALRAHGATRGSGAAVPAVRGCADAGTGRGARGGH